MNPFDTPDTPSFTTTPPSSWSVENPVAMNIDAMLAGLGQQTAGTVSSPVMQVSAIDKPLPSVPITADTHHRYIPSWLRRIGSMVATFVVLIVWYWFISVQYPLETAAFSQSIIDTVNRIIAIVDKNQDNSFLTPSEGSGSIIVADTWSMIDDAIETPLSDALAQAASGNIFPSSTEQVWDDALSSYSGWTDTIIADTLSGVAESGSILHNLDQTMVHAVAWSDVERRESVREKLLSMKDTLNQKLLDLTLGNNTLHLSLVKVALKNIDLTLTMSEQAHDDMTRQEVDVKIEQIDQMYKRLEKL